MRAGRRWAGTVLAVVAAVVAVTGCGQPDPTPAVSTTASLVDTDRFDRITLECEVLTLGQLRTASGIQVVDSTFTGPICRWESALGNSITFNWFEWQSVAQERAAAKQMVYETETVRVDSITMFLARLPDRPAACGATARAPSRGTYTWFVEGSSKDPCEAATELLRLSLKRST